ncbi:FixH family protein, partial [Streptococcus pyogenes]
MVARAAFLIDSESQLGAALRDYERADAGAGAATKESPVSLTFSPPAGGLRAGENVVVVTALDNGRPVTDAEVTVQFSMAAMAS